MTQDVVTAFLLGVSVGIEIALWQIIDAVKDLFNQRKRRK